jgi:hypothetical protein
MVLRPGQLELPSGVAFFGSAGGATNFPGWMPASGFTRLTNSTATIATPWAWRTNRIQVTPYSTNGTFPLLVVSDVTDGASFTVTGSLASDNSTWFWWSIFKP